MEFFIKFIKKKTIFTGIAYWTLNLKEMPQSRPPSRNEENSVSFPAVNAWITHTSPSINSNTNV